MMVMPANAPKRLWTNYFTIAANTNEQKFDFKTQDDYRTRYLDTVFVGLTTSGIALALYAGGQEYSIVDLTRFAAGDQILKVQFTLPAKIQLVVSFTDRSGAGATGVPVVIGYYPDMTVGP